jgi:hypothetical protein
MYADWKKVVKFRPLNIRIWLSSKLASGGQCQFIFDAYAWTLSFSDQPYHGLDLKANYAFQESTETYTSVKGWLVVTSIQDSARISILRLTVQRR